VDEITRLLTTHGIGGVPVVDDRRRGLGIVSQRDLFLKSLMDEWDVQQYILSIRRGLLCSSYSIATARGLPTSGGRGSPGLPVER
jgi:CBS-domain-containing membrane protein